jgi:hypothetical protein
MQRKIFIQTNNKQLLGAKLAKYAIERFYKNGGDAIPVLIINSDETDDFKNFEGTTYRFRGGEERTYHQKDLQSFTLTRLLPPERMNFEGMALVIDPDIFALSDIRPIFDILKEPNTILACKKKDAWDTSVMVLNCQKLPHWNSEIIFGRLKRKEVDYNTLMTLKEERSVQELSRDWNNLDLLTPTTKFLHTTDRLTQPWRTGLKIDFTRNKAKKILGIIPREPILKLLGKYPSHYQQHPDKNIEKFFFTLATEALKAGAFTKDEVASAIAESNIRKDFFEILASYGA